MISDLDGDSKPLSKVKCRESISRGSGDSSATCLRKALVELLKPPSVSTETGSKWRSTSRSLYFEFFFSLTTVATAALFLWLVTCPDCANRCAQVTSQAKGFPVVHGICVIPSGFKVESRRITRLKESGDRDRVESPVDHVST